ncbi:MAG: sigma-70 family RNA polymerase sigma factor [Spirochaetaceae bacterium]|jgi:RNA polymerase sigma-70 factor (ECF subfamily)|nr:sigma-70 family RNA polymerase sigma factor [Spirochaetaceae bacterium]
MSDKKDREAAGENRDIAQWISQAAQGDFSAFSQIVRLYKNRIAALGMGFFKNMADTEDFVQDVFIRIFTGLRSFRGESRFSTWITRIAYNTAINAMNRRKVYESIANEDMIPDESGGPEEEQMRRVAKEALLEAMGDLPEQHSLCLDLFFFHDLSLKEISDTTGLPVNTVKSHIFRAKRALRDKLIEKTGVE